MFYKRKTEKFVTVYVTILSQIQSCLCDKIVTEIAVTTLNS